LAHADILRSPGPSVGSRDAKRFVFVSTGGQRQPEVLISDRGGKTSPDLGEVEGFSDA
jgi:hypothetical protein